MSDSQQNTMADTPGVLGVLNNHSAASYTFDNDGTPVVQEIETVDQMDQIYEHRRQAYDRSITNTISFIENHPLNQSSFLDMDEGTSTMLYSKSSERDKAALENF